MKNNRILLALLLAFVSVMAFADVRVNLTPRPKEIVEGTGSVTLPSSLQVCCNLDDSLKSEAENFIDALNKATDLNVSITTEAAAFITMQHDASISAEGYQLTISTSGIIVKASTTAGFFYAFQSIKKMLPANVMAGVKDANVKTYSLPIVTINDEPRFGYRGFMLDVSRHFFTVEEVKRMIDIMAVYKMNVFHWHLTDDQGWRVEIKKYPKLTSVGSIRSNSWTVDMDHGDYWTNAQYGPYFYTQEEIKDVVEYCHERHIKVIPEVDMPGHFVAAMVSYPEYSCTLSASRSVWTNGGISSDVLNVANAKAVDFCKDILSELIELFPDGYVHIGGDECPTSAWQNNDECKARYTELGLTDYRQLQSHFISEINEFVNSKGYKMIMWNESITANGADLDLMKKTGATVMCWNPCQSGALKAAEMGLDNIITEYHSTNGGYYINRKQSTDAGEPTGAGYGDDSVEGCYNYVPVPTSVSADLLKYYKGVQGTFWTEHVANRKYMEYLALPRLMAVAEAGWTPQAKKDFSDFRLRMMADTVMLNYNGYNYGRHAWKSLIVDTVMPTPGKYYRIVTRCTDNRANRCIELLRAASPLVSTYSGNGAQANRLWTNEQAPKTDVTYKYQQWTFEEDPANKGHFALVCKAQPKGSVKPNPTANGVSGRWDYDTSTKHYSFVLGDRVYGVSGNKPYYTIRSLNTNGLYINSSMAGQGFAANLYSDPTSGNCGLWTFESDEKEEEKSNFSQAIWDSLPKFTDGDTIQLVCNVEGMKDICIASKTSDSYVVTGNVEDANTRWLVVSASAMDSTYSQTFKLKNCATNRYIGSSNSSATGHVGYLVKSVINTVSACRVKVTYDATYGDYQIFTGNYNVYPLSATSPTMPSTISSGNTDDASQLALRPQGAAWLITYNELMGITSTTKEQSASSAVYNINGQRITHPIKNTIYIQNGKKIK